MNDLLVKACALALVAVPDVNIQFDEAAQSIRRFTDADISVAVALPAGLITPIVRSANRKSISDISNEIHSLVTRAKAGTLKPEEFQGGTFSLSNLGMLGVRQFDAIINPPQSAILAIGAGEVRAVVRDGQIVARQQMTVSLSCDHRVIDGAAGAAFLRELKRLIETPTLMFIQRRAMHDKYDADHRRVPGIRCRHPCRPARASYRISGKTTSGRHLPELGMHSNHRAAAWR